MKKKINMQTIDRTSQNIDKIKELFPHCVTEIKDENGDLTLKVDFEQLRQELSSDIVKGNPERYLLTWPGKKAAMIEANKPINKTLRPAKKESVNFEKTKNLYIEGDNLDALKLLQENYQGKVKLIYIDPPYNTGKDPVYNDNYSHSKDEEEVNANIVDEYNNRLETNNVSNGSFHSDWLSMMYPRLKLARNLLDNDGVIFISIDDHEVHNLRKICDEIFGEDNILSMIVVNRTSEIASANNVSKHEYILAYAKNINYVKVDGIQKITISRGTVGNEDQTTPTIVFPSGLKCYNITDGVYNETRKITNSRENIENYDPIIVKNGKLDKPVRLKARWRSSNDMRNFFNNKCLPTKAKINGTIEEIYFENDRFNPQIKKKTFEKISSLFLENTRGSNELESLGLNVFDYPKSTILIKSIIEKFDCNDGIILDFFSGSATSAHAVMQLNAEDGGSRRFIMVQLPENTPGNSAAYKAGYKTIAEIGKERIRRAGKKILQENADKEGIDKLDIGFRVLKIDNSNLKDIYYKPDKTDQVKLFDLVNNIKDDRTSNDLLWQVMLECNITLDNPIEEKEIDGFKTYFVDDNSLIACLENGLSEDYLTRIAKLHPLRVAFLDQCFGNDSSKINMSQIFKQYSPNTDIFVL